MKKWKNKYQIYLKSFLLLIIILFSGYTWIFNKLFNYAHRNVKNERKNNWNPYNPDYNNFLYLDDVDQTEYLFNAKEECYILVDINGTDFTSFILDGDEYEVSYGINIFPLDYGEEFTSHALEIQEKDIEKGSYNWITIEPLILIKDNITVNLEVPYITNIFAGGPISILVQPNFSYNWLYLEVDGKVINNIYDPIDYPYVDSAFLCYFVEDGSHIRFDLNMRPKEHTLRFKGNGTINYQVVVNLDWDEDLIDDVEELQKSYFYEELDPTIPNIWGFFEKADELSFMNNTIGTNSGYFRFYLPETYNKVNYLSIVAKEGQVNGIQVDDDDITLKHIRLNSEKKSTPYGILEPGFHTIYFEYPEKELTLIEFFIDNKKILVMDKFNQRDSDADGLKDIEEYNSGMDPLSDDTDQDGLPDCLDTSPLASLRLDKDLIHQIIIPHNPSKNTLLNLVIEKPDPDYSTYKNRIWMDGYQRGGGKEVLIQPVIRLFGNQSILRNELAAYWKDDSSATETFSLKAGDFSGNGDAIPHPTNPNAEYTFIYAKPSEETYEFDIVFPKGHLAKEDNIIDLRFDFIWLVATPNGTGQMQALHFYDFDQDINVQALGVREIGDINYILSTPDTLIEHQIFWALTQNPQLGEPSDYGVENDVIGKGTVDYYALAEKTLEDRESIPFIDQENEVLYVAGLVDNFDFLNKINIKINNLRPSFETIHLGNYSSFFSFSTISHLINEDQSELIDEIYRSENKICYSIGWNNYTDGENELVQKRANILGFPISLELKSFQNSKILKVSQVQGKEIPLIAIPVSRESNLHDKITYLNQTYIEKISCNPNIIFDDSKHIVKEFFDDRQWEVEASALIFNSYSRVNAELLYSYLMGISLRIEETKSMLTKIITLSPEISSAYTNILQRLNKYTLQEFRMVFKEGNYQMYHSFFSPDDVIGENLRKFDDLTDILGRIKTKTLNLEWEAFYRFWDDLELEKLIEFRQWVSNLIKTQEGMRVNLFDPKAGDPVSADIAGLLACWMKKEESKNKLKCQIAGSALIVIGGVQFIFGIMETYNLLRAFGEGKFKNREIEFVARITAAVSTTALGALLIVNGILLLAANTKFALTKTFSFLSKWVPKLIAVVGIIVDIALIAVDIIDAYNKYGLSEQFWFEVLEISIKAGLSVLIPAILIATGHSGWGFFIGILAAIGILIYDWLTGQNDQIKEIRPSIEIIEEEGGIKQTYYVFPQDIFKKYGSLRVGDEVGLQMKVHNDGNTKAYFRARFEAGGSGYSQYQGAWSQGLLPGQGETLSFTRTLTDTAPNLIMKQQIEIDADIPNENNVWIRTHIYDSEDKVWLNLPVLPLSIAEFYTQTTELHKPIDHEGLVQKYEKALEEYRYNDAAKMSNKLRQRVRYDFLEENIGTVPSGSEWIDKCRLEGRWDPPYGSTPESSCYINENDHGRFIHLHDALAGWTYAGIENRLEERRSFGTIEFWVYNTGENGLSVLLIRPASDYHENLYFNFGTYAWWETFKYNIKGPGLNKESCFYPNQWYHVRIDFRLATIIPHCGLDYNCYNLWLNGIRIATNLPVERGGYKFDRLIFSTMGDGVGDIYISGLDFSWSQGYYQGRNYNWNYTLDDIAFYSSEYANLPLKTNILTNLQEEILQIDPIADLNSARFNLDLKGTNNPLVNYEISFNDKLRFHEDFSENDWSLLGYHGNMIAYTHYPSDDIMTDKHGTYADWDVLSTGRLVNYEILTFIRNDQSLIPYLKDHRPKDPDLFLFVTGIYGQANTINFYKCGKFLEETLTWENKPSKIGEPVKTVIFSDGNTGYTFSIPFDPCFPQYLLEIKDLPLSGSHLIGFKAKEYADKSLRPKFTEYFSKCYQGNGYAYMQTNMSEILNLVSPIYDPIKIGPNNRIYIKCKASTSNEIMLKLLKNNNIVKEYVVHPEGDQNLEEKLIEINVNEELSFDQLMFSGQLEDTNYFIVQDIKIKDFLPIITQRLKEPVELDFEDIDPWQMGGIYYLNLDIKRHDNNYLIYNEIIPLRISFNSNFTITLSNEIFSWESSYVVSEINTGTINLKTGDYISINYKTNTTNEINLQLLKNGYLEHEIPFKPRGNIIIYDQYTGVLIDKDVTFDLLKFDLGFGSTDYIIINKIRIMDTHCEITPDQPFNPIDIRNCGNIPEIIEFSFPSVPSKNVDKTLYPEEFDGDNQIIILMPNELRECIFNISIPTEPVSNILSRQIMIKNYIINEPICEYIDSLMIKDIYINSPKNITYNLFGNSGNYPGTFSFENDAHDTMPKGMDVVDTGGTIRIISEQNGHKKVAELYDNSHSEIVLLGKNFSPIKAGSIEFWINFETMSNYHKFVLSGENSPNALILEWNSNGQVEYNDGVNHVLTNYNTNQWYHYRIEFNCSSDWHLWLDDVSFNVGNGYSFNGNPININRFSFGSSLIDENYRFYIDAIGLSWDLGYNLGDNTKQGIFLSVISEECLSNYSYSLDGAAEISFNGPRKIIPAPETDGVHKIQVTGKNTLNQYFESEMRYFSIKYPINVVLEQRPGHYSTYNFEDEEVGTSGLNIDFVDIDWSNRGCEVSIADIGDGHGNVIQLMDNSNGNAIMINNFDSDVIGGFEFWVRKSSKDIEGQGQKNHDTSLAMGIWDSSNNLPIVIAIDLNNDGKIRYSGYSSSTVVYENFIHDTWFHIRIIPDFNSQTYDIYVNNKLVFENALFYQNANDMREIDFRTGSVHTYGIWYIDSFGYEWDPNYNLGDNLKEGLLIDYEPLYSIELEKIEYSLDNQEKIILSKNTIIPFPTEGIHSIQLCGSDKKGNKYYSEVKKIVRVVEILTLTGKNVEVIDPISGLVILFEEVINSGFITIKSGNIEPEPPSGFRIIGQCYEIRLTALYEGNITLGLPYIESAIYGNEYNVRLLHWEEDFGWKDITKRVDIETNLVYGEIISLSIFLLVEPEDITPPIINIEYKDGDYSDGNSGLWNVSAVDPETGIDHESIKIQIDGELVGNQFGEYTVPIELGLHTIYVEVQNNNYIPLQGSETNAVIINDDDTISPIIDFKYIGGGMDSDPGYFEWSIYDTDNGLGDNDIGLSNIQITFIYNSTEGLDDYVLILPPEEYGVWELPPYLGNYTIQISATDNDDDRTIILDSLTTEIIHKVEIYDDDIDAPELYNLVISPSVFTINFTFEAIDYSGIDTIRITVSNEIVEPLYQSHIGDTYKLTIENHWLFKKGFSEVFIEVSDADNDRPNDSLASIISGTFKNVLWDMYDYVDWQIEELKDYIENTLDFKWKRCLIHKLTKAQENLGEAFDLIQTNKITHGLCYDFIAKIYLRITEIKTELLNRKNWIPDETADYIITTLHSIRNNIVILMGASTGSELAYDIAYLEVELLNLNDYIEEELPCCVRKYLGRKIWCASKLLEIAIFRISEGKEIDCLLRCAQWKLEWTLHKIDCLLEKGKISEVQASYLQGEISEIITKIESLNN
ncbi:MAG: hypothetical protein ACFE9S_16955 [Candidatus Hermodarchaeota archaeon]